jgi:hypothetical protein
MRWADRKEFLEIIVSPRMYADHWHFQMLLAFDEYKKQKQNKPAQINHSADIV